MSPNTEKLLDLLNERQLVPDLVLQKVRARAEKQDASPRAVVKYLVEKGHLTRSQSDNLLKEVGVGSATAGKTSSPKGTSTGLDDLAPLDAAGTAGMQSLDALLNEPSLGAAVASNSLTPNQAKRGLGRNKWDTKLMLYGGGGLLAMVLLIVFFSFLIFGQSEEDMFKAAETAYSNGNYSDAITKYNEYLDAFPESDNHSLAVVHRGLSQLRQVVDAKAWEDSLVVANRVLPEIRQQRQFAQARADLKIMLPDIVQGLVTQAKEKQSLPLLIKAQEALVLAEDEGNIPKEMRSKDKMQNIQIEIRNVERILRRDERLAQAVTEINQAVAGGDTATAYQTRKDLLAKYPGLLTDAQLQEAVLAASQAEKSLVKYVEQSRNAETGAGVTPLAGEAIPVSTTGTPAGGVAGEVITALVNGSVYAVDATEGKLLWRCYVGYDSVSPVDLPGGDLLLFDSVRSELVRAGGRDGNVSWRLPISGLPMDVPVLTADGAFVVMSDRRLLHINLESGQQLGYYEFPQGLRTAPAASRDGGALYLLGEHSNLFVINHRERSCAMVMHIGHEAGEIHIGPHLIGAYLVVPMDIGSETSRLLVLETGVDGVEVTLRQSDLEVRGHVFHQPAAAGKLFVLSTDRGGHYVYDVKPAGAATPLTLIAQLDGVAEIATVPFTFVRGSAFWAAGKGLVKHEIQATASSIRQVWVRHNQDTFLQPVRAAGDVLFTLRRQSGEPGDILSAVSLTSGDAIWETHIASSLVDQPWIATDGSLNVMSVAGSMFTLPKEPTQTHILEPGPKAPVSNTLSADARIQSFPEGVQAFPRRNAAECLTWNAQKARFSIVRLPGVSSCHPLTFGENLLVPAKDGRVYLVNPQDGSNVVEPFQPIVEPGIEYAWRSQANASGAKSILLHDGISRLYLIGVNADPRPHLASLAEEESLIQFRGDFVRLNEHAYGVDTDRRVVPLALTEQTIVIKDAISVPGGVAWGPHRAGDLAMVCSASGELHAWNDSGVAAWTGDRAAEGNRVNNPVGTPLVDDSGCWISEQDGQLVHVDAGTGTVDQRLEVGRPLASGPIVWNDSLVIAGLDGSLLMIDKP
ncbi:MAG: PQQ-like beta-propeller repeat protein [Pirellulales bacterium]|nr:PQQ-like beta-propeller repeat protein [Pirellulales bacterium]